MQKILLEMFSGTKDISEISLSCKTTYPNPQLTLSLSKPIETQKSHQQTILGAIWGSCGWPGAQFPFSIHPESVSHVRGSRMRSSLHFPQDEPYNHSPEYEDSNLPLSSPNHGRAKMQVLYEFEARNVQELTVAQGEILEVRPMLEARKRGGWWWEVQLAWWAGSLQIESGTDTVLGTEEMGG